MNVNTETDIWDYNSTAPFYEFLAYIYSMGQIQKARHSQIEQLSAGDKILYAGVGPGKDALLSARKGINVTCVDIAPAMIKSVINKFTKAGLDVEAICIDVMKHDRQGHYDAVAANFFLNIFPEQVMVHVLSHLSWLIKPGGKLFIADFAFPNYGFLSNFFQLAYYRLVNIAYWMVQMAPLHPIYDYVSYLRSAGLTLEEVRRFKLVNYFNCYQSITAVKNMFPPSVAI